jgi:hypothetical protein
LYDAERAEVVEKFARIGFYETTTGGGCTALEKVFDDGETTLITIADDAQAPTSMNDRVICSVFDKAGNVQETETYDTAHLLYGTLINHASYQTKGTQT